MFVWISKAMAVSWMAGSLNFVVSSFATKPTSYRALCYNHLRLAWLLSLGHYYLSPFRSLKGTYLLSTAWHTKWSSRRLREIHFDSSVRTIRVHEHATDQGRLHIYGFSPTAKILVEASTVKHIREIQNVAKIPYRNISIELKCQTKEPWKRPKKISYH